MTTTYRPEVREGAAQILWGQAELLDNMAEQIDAFQMTHEQAAAYLRDLAIDYRTASSAATAGKDSL
jgi:hypothetical protein